MDGLDTCGFCREWFLRSCLRWCEPAGGYLCDACRIWHPGPKKRVEGWRDDDGTADYCWQQVITYGLYAHAKGFHRRVREHCEAQAGMWEVEAERREKGWDEATSSEG